MSKTIFHYTKYPKFSRVFCNIFGHKYHRVWESDGDWTGGGDELCRRCSKYRYKDEYWNDPLSSPTLARFVELERHKRY